MDNNETSFRVKRGDMVAYFRRQHAVADDNQASIAMVTKLGMNGRHSLHIFNQVGHQGGGRVESWTRTSIPADCEATSQQLTESGTWMPLEDFHEWCSEGSSTLSMRQYLDRKMLTPQEYETSDNELVKQVQDLESRICFLESRVIELDPDSQIAKADGKNDGKKK